MDEAVSLLRGNILRLVKDRDNVSFAEIHRSVHGFAGDLALQAEFWP
ncbi:MAG TPA: hypothetical protein VG796_14220 [Verrucomicrobiales bacterium]|nr:hypothetical protein [Verrucomicrobiales bacterium]